MTAASAQRWATEAQTSRRSTSRSAISERVLHRSSVNILETSTTFCSVRPVEGRPNDHNWSFPQVWIQEIKCACIVNDSFLIIWSVSDAIFPSPKQNLNPTHCSSIRNPRMSLNKRKNKHPLRSRFGLRQQNSLDWPRKERFNITKWQKAILLAVRAPSGQFGNFWICLRTWHVRCIYVFGSSTWELWLAGPTLINSFSK